MNNLIVRLFSWLSLCGIVAILASGCATVPPTPPVLTEEPVKYLKELCEKYNINWQRDSVTQVVTLRTNKKMASFLVGTDLVLIGNDKIILSSPIKSVRSAIVVPPDFKRKVIDVLLATKEGMDFSLKKVREIMIDPGHGGKDPGAIGRGGTKEKDIVLDVARRLKKILERQGIKVKMTRDSDEFISLEERTVMASKAKVDLFVSVHANSNKTSSVSGVEVYSLKDLTALEKNEAQRQENHKTMYQRLSMKQRDLHVHKIIEDMLYTYKQNESEDLADDVARKTSGFVVAKNRGSRVARFYVLRNTLVPAILAEIGFVTNSREEKLMKTSVYRQKIAYGLARGILDYVNSD